MPPEIITTKRDTEIGRLLERVIRDHRKDISAFSKGHLNENNLYKPPEAGRKSWETAKLPAIKLKNTVSLEPRATRDKKMWEAVACFSAGSAFSSGLSSSSKKTKSHAISDDELGIKIEKDDIHLEEFDASYFLLPQSSGFRLVPSLTGCIRKRDELEQRKMYDATVVDKHNLTDRGWYNGTRALKNIKTAQTGRADNIQIYQRLWDELLEQSEYYNPLLGNIKDFYNGYLEFMREKSMQSPLPSGTRSAELKSKVEEIARLTQKVEDMEQKALKKIQANEQLKEEHVVTETVLSEIKLQTEEVQSCSSTDISVMEAPTIATNIDQLRRDILHKKAEIEELKKYQRKEMVPMPVYQCMVQCVQSAEIELQKQIKNKEGLEKKMRKYEEQIKEQGEHLLFSSDQTQKLIDIAKMLPS